VSAARLSSLAPQERLLVALDTVDLDRAVGWAKGLAGHVGGVKVGKEFFTSHGPVGVRAVTAGGLPLFLDLKYHDIPQTVAGAIRAALPLKPRLINVHAAGGAAMMKAAAAAAGEAGADRPLLLAVTVLTSLDDADLAAVGVTSKTADQVLRLARLAQACGLDGVVCSGAEIAALRAACGADFALVVPGIRPPGAEAGDQKRVMTPAEALAAGADYLVIGRPITGAANPAQAAAGIVRGLARQ
jgi:orotidine-5'-phosphate decarboxylase